MFQTIYMCNVGIRIYIKKSHLLRMLLLLLFFNSIIRIIVNPNWSRSQLVRIIEVLLYTSAMPSHRRNRQALSAPPRARCLSPLRLAFFRKTRPLDAAGTMMEKDNSTDFATLFSFSSTQLEL